MLKALWRERHWQNYAMFKRAYQKVAGGLHKDLVETHPSRATLFRGQTGQVKELPYWLMSAYGCPPLRFHERRGRYPAPP